MEHKHEELGVSFTTPDKLTVRQQLAWKSTILRVRDAELFERHWEAAKNLIGDWKCEAIPDPNVSLDEIYDRKQADIIMWVGNQVARQVMKLDELPKNS